MVTTPHITVVIPTCNRSDDMHRCLASLTDVSYPHWDIMVVDQSDDSQTESVVASFTSRLPGLTYHRMAEKGQSGARNIGMMAAVGEIIAFLDDDCTVEADWLRQVAAVFARHPGAGLVFGTVNPAPHNPEREYVPHCAIATEHALRGRLSFRHILGMGASMYVRRTTVQQVGPFDIFLGPGAYFPYGGDDRDYPYRCLAAGYAVVQTPSVRVLHYGARSQENDGVSRLLLGYAFAEGTVQMKHARLGDWAAMGLIFWHCWDNLRGVNYRNLVLRRRPTHVNRLVMYLRGLYSSFQLGVDRRRRLYIARPECDVALHVA